jgi:hypothetical protein
MPVAPKHEKKDAPQIVAPRTNFTIGFPFSHVHIEEPSDLIKELAKIVAGLAHAMATGQKTDFEALALRAEALEPDTKIASMN